MGDARPHCELSDASVLLSLTSMPMTRQVQFLRNIHGFFKSYRHELAASMRPTQRAAMSKSALYQPHAYIVLSTFDLALVALVDDFEFGTQTFTPGHPIFARQKSLGRPRRTPVDFHHRTILGPCPRWGSLRDHSRKQLSVLGSLVGDGVRPPHQPLIGICQIEVNSSFLIGTGGSLLRCLVKAVRALARTRRDLRSPNLEVLVLESYSWHELTVLVGSNTFGEILDFILALRGLTLLDVGTLLCSSRDQPEWLELLDLESLYGRPMRKVRGGTHLGRYLACPAPENPRMHRAAAKVAPFDTHVFHNTTTTLGFSARLLVRAIQGRADVKKIVSEAGVGMSDHLYLVRHWTAKAGHHDTAAEGLAGLDRRPRDSYIVTSGRADFFYPSTQLDNRRARWLAFKETTSAGVVEEMLRGWCNTNRWGRESPRGEMARGLRAVRSSIAFKPSERMRRLRSQEPMGHRAAHAARRSLVFAPEYITALFSQLIKRSWIPKAVTERVLNVIGLYNQGIQDNFLFSSFLELRPYVDRIRQTLETAVRGKDLQATSTADLSSALSTLVDNFELGWRNRFSGGWRLAEVADFNLEFKGGVQQLVSAFHGAYRFMSWFLTGDTNVLAVVCGQPSIQFIRGAVHMSLFDIFKPEFFAARIGHEASEPLVGDIDCDVPSYASRLPRRCKDALRTVSAITSPANGGPFSSSARFKDLVKEMPRAARSLNSRIVSAGLNRPEFFTQVYADFCNFNWVYAGDSDLYNFWAFASFVVDPVNWMVDHSVSRERLREFLVRTAFTLYVNSIKPKLDWPDVTRLLLVRWIEIKDGDRAVQEAVEIAKRMCRCPTVEKWLLDAAFLAGDGRLESHDWVRRLRHRSRTMPAELADHPWTEALNGLETYMREIERVSRREVIQQLRQGRAFRGGTCTRTIELSGLPPLFKDALVNWFDFCDTTSMLHSYLRVLKDACLHPRGGRILLRRDPKTGSTFGTNSQYRGCANLLFDPRGGTFTINARLRRLYFMWRCTLVMSLWDIGEKAKIRQIKEVRRESSMRGNVARD